MDHFFDNLNGASVGITVITFVVVLIACAIKRRKPKLESVLASGLSASAIPTGFALLLCAFFPDQLVRMTDYGIHIAVAGCALLYISVRGISTGLENDNAQTETVTRVPASPEADEPDELTTPAMPAPVESTVIRNDSETT